MKEGTLNYISGEEAIKHMAVAKGFKVSLFADEARFPQLVEPGADAVRHQGPPVGRRVADLSEVGAAQADERRAAHPARRQQRRQSRSRDGVRQGAESARLRVLERRRHRHLQSELLFLKDTDGDDVADVRIIMLQGARFLRHAPRREQPHLRPRRRHLLAERRLHGAQPRAPVGAVAAVGASRDVSLRSAPLHHLDARDELAESARHRRSTTGATTTPPTAPAAARIRCGPRATASRCTSC